MIVEAFIIGIKEGVKLSIVWFVIFSYFYDKDKEYLIRPFFAGISLVFLSSVISFFFIPGITMLKVWIPRFLGFSFAVFFIASVGALYQSTGLRLFNIFGFLAKNDIFLRVAIFLTTVFFFLPDSIGSLLFIKDLSLMREAPLSTYSSALAGFSLAVTAGWAASRKNIFAQVGKFFGITQILLFLSVVKLLGSGIKGYAELSLIPVVQRGMVKFFHDIVHQVLILLMVPDHPLLSKTTFSFIGFFFSLNIAMFATLFVLLLPPAMFLYHSVREPIAYPAGSETGAKKRKFRFNVRSERRKKALPVIFFAGAILFVWFSQRGTDVSALYNPKPVPVVEDNGFIVVPTSDPTMNILDGRLHKFSFVSGSDTIRILIIKKPDNTLSACLDACEICPPEGYGQREKQVVCIYCNTPIPIKTLGEPGGCNPIPLRASVTEKEVRIEVEEILKKWQDVKTGRTKEGVK